MWKDCVTDLKPLQKAIKQFVPRLRTVEEKQGYCIKMIFACLNNSQRHTDHISALGRLNALF